MTSSLYERIGGDIAVRATVARLYELILNDEMLAPFFENIDVDRLRNSQAAFVTYAFGGPPNYTGNNLRDAHKDAVTRGLSDKHFNAVAGYLSQAMRELGVAQPLIDEALSIVETTRSSVLNR